jgi:hypothetical protein
MKTKMTLLIVFSAIVTLSFTFAATRNKESKNEPVAKTEAASEPLGGLVSEESR